MDITVVSTGRTFRRLDDCTGLLLIEAFPESFKRIDPRREQAAPAPPVPRFYVASSPHSGAMGIHVQLPTAETRSVFTAVVTSKQAEAALGAGPLPDAVWEQFVRQRDLEQRRISSGSSANTHR
jgi:hypothetical protein